MQRNRHSYREADGDTQERGDEVHVLLQEVVDLPQAVLGGDRHPLQHGSSSGGGGGLRPPNSAATTPNRNGGKGGTQHCTAGLLRGQLSFFSAACCNLGRQTSAVFSITTIRLRFSWDDAFWTVGDVRAHR